MFALTARQLADHWYEYWPTQLTSGWEVKEPPISLYAVHELVKRWWLQEQSLKLISKSFSYHVRLKLANSLAQHSEYYLLNIVQVCSTTSWSQPYKRNWVRRKSFRLFSFSFRSDTTLQKVGRREQKLLVRHQKRKQMNKVYKTILCHSHLQDFIKNSSRLKSIFRGLHIKKVVMH